MAARQMENVMTFTQEAAVLILSDLHGCDSTCGSSSTVTIHIQHHHGELNMDQNTLQKHAN